MSRRSNSKVEVEVTVDAKLYRELAGYIWRHYGDLSLVPKAVAMAIKEWVEVGEEEGKGEAGQGGLGKVPGKGGGEVRGVKGGGGGGRGGKEVAKEEVAEKADEVVKVSLKLPVKMVLTLKEMVRLRRATGRRCTLSSLVEELLRERLRSYGFHV